MAESPALLSDRLKALRDAGWSVAVHNDYRLSGERRTFWLFTNVATGRFAKGEGFTDEEAIDNVMQVIGSIMCEEREVCRKPAPKPEPRAEGERCKECGGSGEIEDNRHTYRRNRRACPACHGTGAAPQTQKLEEARKKWDDKLKDLSDGIESAGKITEADLATRVGPQPPPEKAPANVVRTLVFIVNGRDVCIQAFGYETLVSVKQCALEQSENTGRPSADWGLRDMQGQLVDESKRADDFADSARFYLSLGVGSGGAHEIACVVCGAWHESDVLLSRSSNECARELRQDLAEARIQLAAYAQGRELDLISSRESGRDKTLPEDEAISAAFPTRTGKHELYAEAMRLVGAKHSKGALVALVNWLLTERDRVST